MSSVTRRSAHQGGVLVDGASVYRDGGKVSLSTVDPITDAELTHVGIDVSTGTTSNIDTGINRAAYTTTILNTNKTSVTTGNGTLAYRVTLNRVYN